jgi:hypothetical protein
MNQDLTEMRLRQDRDETETRPRRDRDETKMRPRRDQDSEDFQNVCAFLTVEASKPKCLWLYFDLELTVKVVTDGWQTDGHDVVLKVDADVHLDQSDVEAGAKLVVIGMDNESRDFSLDERPFLQTCGSKS